jgi:hypothetical protein
LALLFLLVAVGCGGDEVVEPINESMDVAPTVPLPAATATLPPPVINEAGDQEVVDGETTAGVESVPETELPWSPQDFGYGIQIHGNATMGDPAGTMQAVRDQLGLDWVKMQLQWWLIQPEPQAGQWFFYDAVVEQAKAHGLHLLVSVVGAPGWTRASGTENGPPDDYALFAEFLREMLTRYQGQIDAVEVWNEQNLDREWSSTNGVSPEDYVEFLRVANEAIKSIDPDIIVVSGALAPTGPGDWVRWADDFEYLDRALAAGLLDHADCVGAHHNGYNIAPDVAFDEAGDTAEAATAFFRGPFDNPAHSWSFKTTLDTYAAKVQALDPAKKLCVTEFGWASSEGYEEYPKDFGFARDNTLQEQADYLVQAFQQMYDSGDVWLAFMFNFDFGNKGSGPTDDPVPYSIVDIQGVPRPAFGAIAAMEKPR